MTCSRNGILSTGTIALGVLQVRGCSLVASPPIRITAFMAVMLAQFGFRLNLKRCFVGVNPHKDIFPVQDALYQYGDEEL